VIVDCESLTPIIVDALARGSSVRMTVTGKSMQPFLRNNDVAVLKAVDEGPIRAGEIVLARRADGTCIIHRVRRVSPAGFHLAGDAQRDIEGPLPHASIVARVPAIIRSGKEIRLDRGIRRLAGLLWIRSAPLAPALVAWAGQLRHVVRLT
jgi:signal peptidase